MDSGIILNLQTVSGSNKSSITPKKIPSFKEKKYDKAVKEPSNLGSRKRKYIDPKDFVPISSLFEKNPEIPTLIHNDVSTARTEDVTFSSTALEDLPINNKLKGNLKDQFKFTSLTKIQMLSIPSILNGRDTMIKSPTGSGKTMCYAIPIVESLSVMKPTIHRSDGPYAIVLLPTRELALQVFNIFQELCKSSINIVPGLLVGGEKCKAEKSRLRKGINILVATPGRLNYHLKETASLDLTNVSWLVLDEVDRLLDMGFLAPVTEVVCKLDNKASNSRQSVLLSATLNAKVDTLAKVSMKNPVFVDTESGDCSVTSNKKAKTDVDFVLPESLQQSYVFVPAKLRLVSLFSFLANKCFTSANKCKVIVFMPNKASVSFYLLMFKLVLKEMYNISEKSCQLVFQLQGDQSQNERFETFKKFKLLTNGVLFCTDVAARGLDIKNVNWIIQFSCPQQIEDYCHKVGRTARIGMQGKSMLFLLPSEKDFISLLSNQSIVLEEYLIDSLLSDSLQTFGNKKTKSEEKATKLQNFVEETIVREKDYYKMAIAAHSSFIQSYSTYPGSMKEIFHPKKLHLGHIAKSFGLREAPGKFKVNLKPQEKSAAKEKAKKLIVKKKTIIPADGIYSGPRPGKKKTIVRKKGSK